MVCGSKPIPPDRILKVRKIPNKEKFSKKLGKILRQLREEQRLSQEELARKKHSESITPKNVTKAVYNASTEERMMKSNEWQNDPFDSNIQQVKPDEFDVLYYGLFFADKVMIFKLTSEDLGKAIRYSNRQHKGNVGEGQFHLNPDTYQYHLDNFFEIEYTYSELLNLFKSASS